VSFFALKNGKEIILKEKDLKFEYEVPFTMIESSILLSEDLIVDQKTIYCILCAYASNTDKSCYPSYTTIAQKAGCSRRKAISVVTELITMGYINKKEQINSKGEKVSNIYHICHHLKKAEKPQKGSAGDTPSSEQSTLPPDEQDTPPGKCDTPRSAQDAPELYPYNYKENNYNHSLSEISELEEILMNCEIEKLYEQKDKDLFTEAITTMYESKEIRVRGKLYPQSVVHENMKKLNYVVIAYAFDALKAMTQPPRSPINYLVSVLYRGIVEAACTE